ncbi:hypothetical protein SE91_28160 [Bradyrhizobium sp. DOA1]|nr:hypothetical protein SE91_28160 [Bradyrhizobium sp. DOA1]
MRRAGVIGTERAGALSIRVVASAAAQTVGLGRVLAKEIIVASSLAYASAVRWRCREDLCIFVRQIAE